MLRSEKHLRPNLLRGLLAAAVFGAAAAGGAARADLAACIDATCRITAPDGGRGTGCVFALGPDRVYVLTCHHVVGNHAAVECEFWSRGHQSRPLPGRVIARSAAADAAVVVLDAALFEGVVPPAVPLAPPGRAVRPGETLASVGCAGGRWATGWKGHSLGSDADNLYFLPPPADGRSGSAVFDAEGTTIVGLLRARTGDGAVGIATSADAIHRAFGQQSHQTIWRAAAKPTNPSPLAVSQSPLLPISLSPLLPISSSPPLPISPAQCPGGACPAPRNYLLPYRYHQQFRGEGTGPTPGAPSPTWPTLPQQAGPPEPRPIDLGPTNERLDRIAALLEQLRGGAGGSTPSQGSSADEPGEADTRRAVAEVREQLDAARQESSKLRQAVEAVVGDRETLEERIAARISRVKNELGEEAGVGSIAREYARDLAVEKLRSGEIGLSLGKVLGGALGLSGPLALALGGGMWLISRRIGRRLE
jgi:hypothetical protein